MHEPVPPSFKNNTLVGEDQSRIPLSCMFGVLQAFATLVQKSLVLIVVTGGKRHQNTA
jgi:hypothetical protein